MEINQAILNYLIRIRALEYPELQTKKCPIFQILRYCAFILSLPYRPLLTTLPVHDCFSTLVCGGKHLVQMLWRQEGNFHDYVSEFPHIGH
jgi:hypothetical protein